MPSLMLLPFATVAAVVPVCPSFNPTPDPNLNPNPDPIPNPNPDPIPNPHPNPNPDPNPNPHQVPVCLFFFLGAFLLVTSQPEALADKVAALNATLTLLGESQFMEEYASGSAAAGSSLSDAAMTKLAAADGETLMRAMAVYWFFGLLWTVQFVQACSWTTLPPYRLPSLLPYYLTTTLLTGVQLDHNERRGGLLVLLP